ncbi:MAG: glycosyltransferase [Bacteroidales bacterium]|nr:glycosyltransferase [Bacteroidales bacterium]
MKILQLCNKPPYPPHDGGSMAMFHLASSLSEIGHSITVLAMRTPKHLISDKQLDAFNSIMPVHTTFVDTTTRITDLIKNLLFSTMPYNAKRFIDDNFADTLASILTQEAFDVVQLEGLYLTPYLPVIRKHSDAIVALRAHNIEHEIWKRNARQEKNPFKKIYFILLSKRIKRFERRQINLCDVLVPITARDKDHFDLLGNTRPSHICPAGIDMPEDFEKDKHKNLSPPASLYFLGSLDWLPNLEGLLWFARKVFPELKKRHPVLEMHVAGRNAPAKLSQLLEKRGIRFHGEVSDAPAFIRSKNILVAPCFSGSGMRLKIIEAMSQGKPVVTTPIGAEGLDAEHEKHIIIAENVNGFLLHIERLINNPDLCHELGRQGALFVAGYFNNRNIARQLADFYQAHLT